jgi:hypothetical protein
LELIGYSAIFIIRLIEKLNKKFMMTVEGTSVEFDEETVKLKKKSIYTVIMLKLL